jgi:hypothetical protein
MPAWELDLAVIATAGFVIDVVPVMDSPAGFAVKALFEQPAKRTREHDSEIGPPAIRLFPLKPGIENHGTETTFIPIIPQLQHWKLCLFSWFQGPYHGAPATHLTLKRCESCVKIVDLGQ